MGALNLIRVEHYKGAHTSFLFRVDYGEGSLVVTDMNLFKNNSNVAAFLCDYLVAVFFYCRLTAAAVRFTYIPAKLFVF